MKRAAVLILAVIMMFGICTVRADSTERDISIYLTLSKYGEIVKEKNESDMAYIKLVLSGQESYTIDDALKKAHELFFEEGADGYSSSVSEWGLGVDMLWGDDSGNFGYTVNGTSENVMGAGHLLSDGDHLEAFVYKNLYPETECYSKFNKTCVEADKWDEVTLTLFESSYDEEWNVVFLPCVGAKILINGVETEYFTDESGNVSIQAKEEGTFIISAKKEKTVNEAITPAICAPVCILTVENPATEIIHNIAKLYSEINLEDDEGNLPWIFADMAIYGELFPESEYKLSEDREKKYVKALINSLKDMKKPGDMAKTIIALRSAGYDASRVFVEDFKKYDIVASLCELCRNEDERVTNIYTLPYILIALCCGEDYMDEKIENNLLNCALEKSGEWMDTEFGTDAITPMILALSPYYEENEDVKTTIDTATETLLAKQREDGLIDGMQGYEGASTGLAICALASMGIDADEVKKGEKSLVDGLLSTANEEKSAFANAFATEQGFRGLLARELLIREKGMKMYDFSEFPMDELNFSPAKYCPVIFSTTPEDASVIINGGEKINESCFDINEGTYTYTVSRAGYTNKSGSFDVTKKDAANHSVKKIEISLSRRKVNNGGSTNTSSGTQGNYTGAYESAIPENKETEELKSEVISAEKVFSDVKKEDWYFDSVQYVYDKKLFNGTDKGFEPHQNMTRAMLVTVLYRMAEDKSGGENPFNDVSEGVWYEESVKWAYNNKIVMGMSENTFMPDINITREQIAMIIYRYAQHYKYDTALSGMEKLNKYNDRNEISDYAESAVIYAVDKGIIKGDGELLAPRDYATRAQVATMLMRFMEMVK